MSTTRNIIEGIKNVTSEVATKANPSWILDEETCLWNAPVAYPEDDKMYRWNEETVNWIEVQTSQGE